MNFVDVSTNAASQYGTLDTIVKWDSYWTSSDSEYAYAQNEFKNKYVYPTHYSLKGFQNYAFAKEWYLYGFNSENEEPTLLSEETSEGSTFCGPTCSQDICCNDNWGTFEMNPTNKGFRFFRIKCKTASSTRYSKYRIALRGLEVFGTLSSLLKRKKTYCFKSCPMRNYLPAYALLRMFSVYLC